MLGVAHCRFVCCQLAIGASASSGGRPGQGGAAESSEEAEGSVGAAVVARSQSLGERAERLLAGYGLDPLARHAASADMDLHGLSALTNAVLHHPGRRRGSAIQAPLVFLLAHVDGGDRRIHFAQTGEMPRAQRLEARQVRRKIDHMFYF